MKLKKLASSPDFEAGNSKQSTKIITDTFHSCICIHIYIYIFVNFPAVLHRYNFGISMLYEVVQPT